MAAIWSQATSAYADAFRYDPWGETIAHSPTSSARSPWRYQGRLVEGEPSDAELYDFGFRSYAADTGAFASLDDVAGSAQDVRSLNRFLYANADPATLIDPDGHYAGADEDYRAGPTATESQHSKHVAAQTGTATGSTGGNNRTDSADAGSSSSPTRSVKADDWSSDATSGSTFAPVLTAPQLDLTPRMAGGCVSAALMVPTVLSLQKCVVVDFDDLISGTAAVVTTGTPLTQGSTGFGLTATAGMVFSNARDFDDLEGWFGNVGASGTLSSYALAGDLSAGKTSDKYLVYAVDAGLGRGRNFVPELKNLEFHGGGTLTHVDRFNLGDVPWPTNPWFIGRMWSTIVAALP